MTASVTAAAAIEPRLDAQDVMAGPAPGGVAAQPAEAWPDLVVDPVPAIGPARRPARLLAVAAILLFDGASLLLLAGVAAPLLLVPILGVVVAVAALAAAVGVYVLASWARMLAAALAVYWIAQGLGVGWGWILDGMMGFGLDVPNPLFDVALPLTMNAFVLFVVVRRWPARR